MEPTIRPAAAHDDAALAALERATWSPESSPTPEVTDELPFFAGERTPERAWVALVDGRIVGSVLVGPGIPIPAHRHVAHLRGLSVDPRAQGRGVGRRLVEHALGELGRRGIQKVRSRVLSTNVPSLALHRACGFVEEGRLRDEFRIDPHGSSDDVLLAYRFDRPDRPRLPR